MRYLGVEMSVRGFVHVVSSPWGEGIGIDGFGAIVMELLSFRVEAGIDIDSATELWGHE